jgi:phosphoglycolate phosphatase
MLLCFDFDGTIADSLPVYLELAYRYAAQRKFTPVSVSQARDLGLKGLLAHYHISKLELAKIMLWGLKEINPRIKDFRPFPGIPETLTQLASHHRLGLITSNSKSNIDAFLSLHHLSSIFSFTDSSPDLFGKAAKLKKYHPDYYIGDETRDITAAQKAGCKSVAVTWGFESPALLSSSRPDFIAENPSDLFRIFSSAENPR